MFEVEGGKKFDRIEEAAPAVPRAAGHSLDNRDSPARAWCGFAAGFEQLGRARSDLRPDGGDRGK